MSFPFMLLWNLDNRIGEWRRSSGPLYEGTVEGNLDKIRNFFDGLFRSSHQSTVRERQIVNVRIAVDTVRSANQPVLANRHLH